MMWSFEDSFEVTTIIDISHVLDTFISVGLEYNINAAIVDRSHLYMFHHSIYNSNNCCNQSKPGPLFI